VVIGSGVTGVEFVHMFASFGSRVTLVVSRQQVLPNKDPEVAAALEEEFLRRGVRLFIGARAVGIDRTDDGGIAVRCDDGRVARGSHALLAIGSVPNSEALGLQEAGVDVDDRGYVPINQHCQSNVPHIYAAGDLSGKLPLSSVAAMQGRKIAEHVMGMQAREHRHFDYDKAPQAVFTEPEIAEVGVAEAEAFATGRKIRVTKVPFSSNPKALINHDPRGFVKIVSDPATEGWTSRLSTTSTTRRLQFTARARTEISSAAWLPTIEPPSTTPVAGSETIFTKPRGSLLINALGVVENGTLVTRILRPDANASASARPTSAISGSVKIADAALS